MRALEALLAVLQERGAYRILVLTNADGKSPTDIAREIRRSDIADAISKQRRNQRRMFHSPNATDEKPRNTKSKWANRSKSLGDSLAPSTSSGAFEKTVEVTRKTHNARSRFLSSLGVFHDKK